MINVFQPALGAEELEAVRRVFESNWVGKGRITDEFETRFAGYLSAPRKRVRSISCCTEGLFQSMTLLDIGSGDEVVLPSIHFVGAANAIVESGARPVFCDVDQRTLNATAGQIEKAINSKTKAVSILHYGGRPCEMDGICELVDRTGIRLIEDSACSVASHYRGRACGTFGDVGVWSFDAMKILVTTDGGMIYCNNEELARRTDRLTYLGLEEESGFTSSPKDRWWEFEVSCSGRRAIMNDTASAIGIEQLKKLPRFIARRESVSRRYDEGFAALEWLRTPPPIPVHSTSSYYFYHVQTAKGLRDRLARHLRDNGVYTTFRYYPLHRVRFYGHSGELPNCEEVTETTLCIPIHHSLSDDDVDRVIELVHDFGKSL